MLAKPASALATCSSPGATIAKHHGWGDRLSQFRRPEVQGQGASAGSDSLRRLSPRPVFSLRAHTAFPLCTSTSRFPLLVRTPVLVDCELLIIIHWLLVTALGLELGSAKTSL